MHTVPPDTELEFKNSSYRLCFSFTLRFQFCFYFPAVYILCVIGGSVMSDPTRLPAHCIRQIYCTVFSFRKGAMYWGANILCACGVSPQVLLRVKHNEVEYLHKEIVCLRNEVQFLNTVVCVC